MSQSIVGSRVSKGEIGVIHLYFPNVLNHAQAIPSSLHCSCSPRCYLKVKQLEAEHGVFLRTYKLIFSCYEKGRHTCTCGRGQR